MTPCPKGKRRLPPVAVPCPGGRWDDRSQRTGSDRMTRQPAGALPATAVGAARRWAASRARRMRWRQAAAAAWVLLLAGWAPAAHASFLQGDALDALANGVAWAALIIVPVAGIVVFLLIHILPEKIAEKRKHPQLSAIKTLCLLSLVFGGMLWPIAWLWAYTKPVLHKIAYGTAVDETPHHGEALSPLDDADVARHPPPEDEVQVLRQRVAALEAQLAAQQRTPG